VNLERPDLSRVDPAVKAYIEALEAEVRRLAQFQPGSRLKSREHTGQNEELFEPEPLLEPSELPTTLNLVTISAQGMIKRTPRHLYLRQRRGGMGIFDLDTHGDDYPAFLTIVDENQTLLLFTNFARVFRLPLNELPESPVRARGESLTERITFEPDEHLAAVLPNQASGYIALVSQSGVVRTLRHHLFGEYLKPGTPMFNIKETGPLAAACWTPGDADLLIVTTGGTAIRFAEKLLPPKGELGIRVGANDAVAAITAVRPDSGAFLIGADGKGTVRQMAGFAPNKSTGGGGKIVMKADKVIGATQVDAGDDIFAISRLGKIIRFQVSEVPGTEGVVQGVNCMALRADEVTAMVRAVPPPPAVTFRPS
jgi:DNA gyrase subunit A